MAPHPTDPQLATVHLRTDRIDDGRSEQGGGACLVVLQGQLLGQRFDLDDREVMLGRDADCDFQIEDRSVSRHHARIRRDAAGYRIEDLGSTNGVRLNGQLERQVVLQDGDCIAIGSCVLKFMQRSSVEARYHDEIYQLATRDALTGLCNRRLFLELIERELRRSARYGHPLALLIVDLDHFKAINDSHGHIVGDQVLEQVGALLRRLVGSNALAARIGGEEFAIALPDHAPAAAREFAEQVRSAVAALSLRLGEQLHGVTVSVGVAIWRAGMDQVGALLGAADQALYRAKAAGRNRVEVAR